METSILKIFGSVDVKITPDFCSLEGKHMIFAGLVSGVPGNGPAEFNVFPSQVISPRAFQMKQGDDSKDFLQGL